MPGTIKFDPRALIMGPYITCPKCKTDEFGVLGVRHGVCERRCRSCWYRTDIPLPELPKKKIIYIDQFAFSNIMKILSPDTRGHERTASEPFWSELFETLEVVCNLQLVVCPDSHEHNHESLASSFYKSLKHTYEHFSTGITFHAAEDVRRMQMSQLVACWLQNEPLHFDFDAQQITHGDLHDWNDRMFITVEGELPGFVDELRSMRTASHKGLQEVFEQWQRDKKSFKEVFEMEKGVYGKNLINLYRGQVEKHNRMLAEGKMPSLNDLLPSPAYLMLTQLKYTFDKLGKDESLKKSAELFATGAVNEAPFNVIAASMYASLSQKAAAGQKKIPNHGTATDIEVVSILLPYCDAMFLDNGCRAL